ncbi:Uu.00g065310.m01.CDS01 [Anthostomella pinea]|uniref:Uu.00g065310.m01.CDS01 n=1 Tax=Anthostomella pinea TaxID=933095 RepID=A0AAI8VTQ7_9PEZI|nr:Uu.00g065310.m01.CDS01 [Anthostomella pinea]
MYSLLPLAGFWAWNQGEKALDRRPVPVSAEPKYSPNEVTVLTCTINTLLACWLITWLGNDPLEVIIVTIAEHEEKIRSVVANAELSDSDLAKVVVLVSDVKGKRMQPITGLAHVNGDDLPSYSIPYILITGHPSASLRLVCKMYLISRLKNRSSSMERETLTNR